MDNQDISQPQQPDPELQEIESLKAQDNFQALGQKVQKLMRMPQHLCRTRGNCCRVATFKGLSQYEDIVALSRTDGEDSSNAREFLTLFIPYETVEEVRQIAPVFVERVLSGHQDTEKDPGFFHCRFVAEDGRCMIHEDRPTGCRIYPFPHDNTIYHPGCGFEKTGVENWKKIQDITQYFEKRFAEINSEIADIESLQSEVDADS